MTVKTQTVERAGALRSASPTRLIVQLPVDAQPGMASITVAVGAGSSAIQSNALTSILADTAPAIETVTSFGATIGTFLDSAGKAISLANPAKPGDAVVLVVSGLGATTPAVRTGQPVTSKVPTASAVHVALGDQQVLPQGALLVSTGVYQVTFRLPTSTPSGLQPLECRVLSSGLTTRSNTVLLPVGDSSQPIIGATVSAASWLPGVTAGAWVTVVGNNLSTTSRGWRDSDFAGRTMPTSLDGVSVKINGKPAAISYISPTQLNVQVPDGPASGTVSVEVKSPRGTAIGQARMESVTPAFFTFAAPGTALYVAAVHTDGNLVGPADLYTGHALSKPAQPGEIILLFGTGFGATNPNVPSGELFSGAAPLAAGLPEIRIGGVSAEVKFAGLSAAGLYQFNVVVPNVRSGDQPVVAVADGRTTQAGLAITVGAPGRAPLDPVPDVEGWLAAHPTVAQAVIWEDRGLPKPYAGWTAAQRAALRDAVAKTWLGTPDNLRDPPPNQVQLKDDDFVRSVLSEADAWPLYTSYIAQSLAVEMGNWVPWSLLGYTSQELAALLDSRHLFTWNGSGYEISYYHGVAVPAPPVAEYAFLVSNGLVRSTRLDTIDSLLDWAGASLSHFSGGQTGKNVDDQWHYRGFPPVSLMISGTANTPSDSELSVRTRNRTFGCWGTLGFLRAVLRSVNIPVEGRFGTGHAQVYFRSEDKYMGHGDDPYSALGSMVPRIPPEELLLDPPTFTNWFGTAVPADIALKNVGRRSTNLHVQYLSTYLLSLNCTDSQQGLSHVNSSVYSNIKDYYTLNQLESMGLWNSLSQKATRLGGCPINLY